MAKESETQEQEESLDPDESLDPEEDSEAQDESPDPEEDESPDPEELDVEELQSENSDLRAMLAHYAGEVDIEDLRENNFSRSGKFLAPSSDREDEGKATESKPKAKAPRRAASGRLPKTKKPSKPASPEEELEAVRKSNLRRLGLIQ